MCKRVTLTRPNLEWIGTEPNVDPMEWRGLPICEPHHNIAPTSLLAILTLDDGKQGLSAMKWGLILGPKRSKVINLRKKKAE